MAPRRQCGPFVPRQPPTYTQALTAHKAAGRSLEDTASLQALGVGTGGVDPRSQTTRLQPLGQPVELAVAQEAVALDDAAEERGEINTCGVYHICN